MYVLSRANKLKGTNFIINRDFPKEIVNARRRLWSEYKRLRSANPDSKTNIVYSPKLVSNGRTVADEFPDWSLIMQASRTSTCSPEQYAEQTKPNSTYDRQDKHNQHNNNRESTMRSLNTARAAPSPVVSNLRRHILTEVVLMHQLVVDLHLKSVYFGSRKSKFPAPLDNSSVESCRGPPVPTCTSYCLNFELCDWICQYDSTPLGTRGDRLYHKPTQNK